MHKHAFIVTAAAQVSSGKLRKRNTNTLSLASTSRTHVSRSASVRHRGISAFHCGKLLTVGRVAQLAEQCPSVRAEVKKGHRCLPALMLRPSLSLEDQKAIEALPALL